MANRRFIDFPIASTVGDNDIVLIWQDGLNKQTTKGTLIQGAPTSLEGLTDVDIAGLINGQILQYNSVTGKWENVDRAALNLSELGDVSIVSPSNGQVLIYNSTTSKWENSSAGFVPYTGAVTTVDLGLQGLRAGYIRFDTSVVSVPEEQGIMYWDADNETVDVILNGTIMQIGQDLFYPVKNQTGSTIAKGTAVRFAGTVGASGRLLIAPFIADNSVASSRFMGVTSEAILNGADGKVMWFGRIRGINTNAFNEGDILYASTTTAGGFQTAIPVAPNNIVQVAAVVTKSTNNGAIFVRPTLGSNINKDEGVKIVSGTSGDLLQLQSNGLWENKTIDAAGIVTKATNQTISGVKTFSQDIDVNGVNVGRGGGNLSSNTRFGAETLVNNTTGNNNTSLGRETLYTNTSGAQNTATGVFALFLNTIGNSNTAVGLQSSYNNTTGNVNVAVGLNSLFGNTTGTSNTALGHGAGHYITNDAAENSISNNSVFVGSQTKAQANNQTNQIVIGHLTTGNGSNTVTIGNSSITDNYFTGNITGGAFIKSGGTSAQFLKADGSVDSTSYGTGSVTSVAALTLGTSGTDLSSTVANGTTTPVITLNVPTASASNRGALSATDWSTFNNKQNALTNPVTGTGTAGQVAYWSSGSAITGESNLFWDATNDRLGIGTATPAWMLEVNKDTSSGSFGQYPAISINNPNASGFSAYYFFSGASNRGGFEYSNSTNNLLISANFGERMRIWGSSGNVNIGPTPSSDAGFKLDVNGTGRFSDLLTTTYGAARIQVTSTTNGSNAGFRLSAKNSSGTTNNAGLYFVSGTTTANTFLSLVANDNDYQFNVLANGNVGIGTTGGINVVSGWTNFVVNGSSTGLVGIKANEVDYGAMYASSANNAFVIQAYGSSNNGVMAFLTASTERMRITSNGSIGFNTSTVNRDYVFSNPNNRGAGGFEINSADNIITFLSYNRSTNAYLPISLSEGSSNVLIGTQTNGASRLRIVGLPTSTAGLSSGDVYNLSGVLMIA